MAPLDTIPFWPGKPMRIWPGGVYNSVVTSPDWAIEPKLDGWRCLVEFTADGVRAWTRHGNHQHLDDGVKHKLESLVLPEGTVLDGELMGPRQKNAVQRFVAFDVLTLHNDAPYTDRRKWLEMAAGSGLEIVPQLPPGPESFIASLQAGHEGIVIKKRDASYPFAVGPNPVETTSWLKVKAPSVNGRQI